MKEKQYIVTEKEMKRYDVIQKALSGQINLKGAQELLDTEKASHFRSTRHEGLHYQVEVEQKETQIQRPLSALGIDLINLNTPDVTVQAV